MGVSLFSVQYRLVGLVKDSEEKECVRRPAVWMVLSDGGDRASQHDGTATELYWIGPAVPLSTQRQLSVHLRTSCYAT